MGSKFFRHILGLSPPYDVAGNLKNINQTTPYIRVKIGLKRLSYHTNSEINALRFYYQRTPVNLGINVEDVFSDYAYEQQLQ